VKWFKIELIPTMKML